MEIKGRFQTINIEQEEIISLLKELKDKTKEKTLREAFDVMRDFDEFDKFAPLRDLWTLYLSGRTDINLEEMYLNV